MKRHAARNHAGLVLGFLLAAAATLGDDFGEKLRRSGTGPFLVIHRTTEQA